MTEMPIYQQIITIALCMLATMTTRFLPFIVFREDHETPAFIKYLGKYLPLAVFGMLIVYCFKNVDFTTGLHGIPEIVATIVTVVVHLWKRNMMLSIIFGTGIYMLLLYIF